MKKTLIVVDMQKDFIDGSLGTKEAVAIVNNDKSVYVEFRKQFGNYGGRCNKYCKKMFVMDYGRLKSFAMMNILPKSYYLSKLLIDIVLRKKLR